MKSVNRLLYLDWMRGIAAVIMLQGHVFHSFLRNDLRSGGPYVFSQFVGGAPPAAFLFLAGITLAFLMDSQSRKGLTRQARLGGSLRRAGYLFTIAFAFRIQLWVFTRIFSDADSPWTEMLKVDILNCMGFGIALLAILAVFTTRQRIFIGVIVGVLIAGLSPLVSQSAGAGLPPLLRDYVVPSYNYFAFFPWAAFVAFGISVGSVFRVLRQDRLTQAMQWFALGGLALSVGGAGLSSPIEHLYLKSDFWLDAPSLIVIKLGVLLMLLSFSYACMSQTSAQGWSWVRQLGTTSLLVYWVHIELVYGSWLGWMKMNLSLGQTVLAAIGIIGAMIALSVLKSSWRSWGIAIRTALVPPQPLSSRVSGD